MKILIVAPQPFFRERGTPIAVRLLAETLCQFGHHVDLLAYHAGEDVTIPGLRLIRAARPPGVHEIPIGISWQKLLCDVSLLISMIRLVRRNDYDVIHAVEEAVFFAAVLSLFGRRKFIYDMDSSLSEQLTDKWRSLRPLRGVLERVERMAVSRATTVLAVCEDLATKVRPWVDGQRVAVLPDVPLGDGKSSVCSESLRDIVGNDSVIGLYVGNLEPYQGIDLLLEAVARVSDARFRMIVIGGDPAHVLRYRERVQATGIGDKVLFLGPRPVAQLDAYLSQADILLSPRILGGNTPMKVYSYMQSGKAIVATRIRSHTQAINDSCAELVAPDPEAMAGAIERLARDPERRRRLGEAARERAQLEYSLPVFRKKLELAYQQMADA